MCGPLGLRAKWVEGLLAKDGVSVRVLHEEGTGGGMEEFLSGFMSLVASFAGRLYGMRGKEAKQRLLGEAGTRLEERGTCAPTP